MRAGLPCDELPMVMVPIAIVMEDRSALGAAS